MVDVKICSFDEVIDSLKDIMATDQLPTSNKDLAKALNLSVSRFYYFKKRKTIPLEEVLYFLVRKRISINLVLFKQDTKKTGYGTSRYRVLRHLKQKRRKNETK